VTAPYLAEGMISLSFEGDASGYIPTAVGAVPSPNPYVIATTTLHLLRTQPLANYWKLQQERNTTIGDMTVAGDSSQLSSYYLSNNVIVSVAELEFAGKTPVYQVTTKGVYYINAALWL
jgi:hypothetical protein